MEDSSLTIAICIGILNVIGVGWGWSCISMINRKRSKLEERIIRLDSLLGAVTAHKDVAVEMSNSQMKRRINLCKYIGNLHSAQPAYPSLISQEDAVLIVSHQPDKPHLPRFIYDKALEGSCQIRRPTPPSLPAATHRCGASTADA